MQSLKIFVAEDDKWYKELLRYHLELNPDYSVKTFETGEALLKALHEKPNVVTLDYSLPDYNGRDLLIKVKEIVPDTEVVIVSGQNDVSTAVDLLREGAYDYVVKDDDTKNRIWKVILHIREKQSLQKEIVDLRHEVKKKYDFNKTIKGNSAGIKKVLKLMEKAITNNITVSINGETGTGKEVVAKGIHYHSDRHKAAFVPINVSAIPSELIESELFGYEKGAFTGANARKIGKFEEAGKGTIFLDEIAEMPLGMQSKLLRVLQEREVVRIGGNQTVKLGCRVIVATHKDLAKEVQAGNFRQDLYYRLLGLPIVIPPLRDRKEDILILAKYFVDGFCKESKLSSKSFNAEAKNKLLAYPYPGNIRELKAVVELAAVMADEDIIDAENIHFPVTDPLANLSFEERSLKEFNLMVIQHFLKKYGNNVIKVGEVLQIGKSTIYRLLKENNIKIK